MRLFIRKQNCVWSGQPAGFIPDDAAASLDRVSDACALDALQIMMQDDYKLTAYISDCDSWDGTREDLIEEFEGEIKYLKAKGIHNANDLFRLNRAKAAIKWLEGKS